MTVHEKIAYLTEFAPDLHRLVRSYHDSWKRKGFLNEREIRRIERLYEERSTAYGSTGREARRVTLLAHDQD